MNILMSVLNDHQKRNPQLKTPIVRVGHLVVDGFPFCHSYKQTVEEVVVKKYSRRKGVGGAGT